MRGKILVLMTSHFGLNELVVKNLEALGYEVVYADVKYFKYENFTQRLKNFIQKTVLFNPSYKEKLRIAYNEKYVIQELDFPENHFDYTLVIRPDMFSFPIVQHIKKISNKILAYQWDGLKRFPVSDDILEAYDVFALFDENDYTILKERHPHVMLSSNFYYDFIPPITEKKLDYFYIGSLNDRLSDFRELSEILEKGKFSYQIRLYDQGSKITKIKPWTDNVELSNIQLPYRETLDLSKNAKVIFDFKHPKHNGLSFRFFEALHFSQKIVTNNKSVRNMDFYTPENYLFFDEVKDLDTKQLKDFLTTPYTPIPESVKQKYSFKHWWNSLLEKSENVNRAEFSN